MFDQETEQIQLVDTSSKFVRNNYKKQRTLKFKEFNDLSKETGQAQFFVEQTKAILKNY